MVDGKAVAVTSTEMRIALAEWANMPDLDTDCLDEVHELEKRLSEHQIKYYNNELSEVVDKERGRDGWTFRALVTFYHRHATASQRCEALARTLWPEKFK
jgi:hypothetical protein